MLSYKSMSFSKLAASPWTEADWLKDLVRREDRFVRPGMTYLTLLFSADDGPGAGAAWAVTLTLPEG